MVISNGVLLAAVIFLFMVVVFVFLLYLYAKRYLGANPMLAPVSPSSRMSEDMRSPVSARLRSLRRLLSRGKQAVVGPSFSPRGGGSGDIEQGLAGADAACPPKTPKTPPAAN
uniref:Uncharacterized protein n=1 Tax=Oryza brachyantha TaxID=4533 RepID=J3MC07_ORYBR